MKNIFSVLCAVMMFSLASYAQGNNVRMVVTGNGKTVEAARENALASALQQVYAAFVSIDPSGLNAMTEDEKSSVLEVNDKLNSYSDGKLFYEVYHYMFSLDRLLAIVKDKGCPAELARSIFGLQIKIAKFETACEKTALKDLMNEIRIICSNTNLFDMTKGQERVTVSYSHDNKYDVIVPITLSYNNNWERIVENYTERMKTISLSEEEIERYENMRIGNYSYYDLSMRSPFAENSELNQSIKSLVYDNARCWFLERTLLSGEKVSHRIHISKSDEKWEEEISLTEEELNNTLALDLAFDLSLMNEIAPQLVDMGLSVKWANVNIGAKGTDPIGNVYNITSIWVLNDVAASNFGPGWRIPTKKEFQELLDKCHWDTSDDGYTLTSKINGNTIFLPYTENYSSYYWCGSVGNDATYYLDNCSGIKEYGSYGSYDTYNHIKTAAIRPVYDPNAFYDTAVEQDILDLLKPMFPENSYTPTDIPYSKILTERCFKYWCELEWEPVYGGQDISWISEPHFTRIPNTENKYGVYYWYYDYYLNGHIYKIVSTENGYKIDGFGDWPDYTKIPEPWCIDDYKELKFTDDTNNTLIVPGEGYYYFEKKYNNGYGISDVYNIEEVRVDGEDLIHVFPVGGEVRFYSFGKSGKAELSAVNSYGKVLARWTLICQDSLDD